MDSCYHRRCQLVGGHLLRPPFIKLYGLYHATPVNNGPYGACLINPDRTSQDTCASPQIDRERQSFLPQARECFNGQVVGFETGHSPSFHPTYDLSSQCYLHR